MISCLLLTMTALTLTAPGPARSDEPVARVEVGGAGLTAAAAEAAVVVDAFHAALKAGDTAKAAMQLDASTVIFEGGEVERSKSAYAAHHLAADAAFEKSATLSQTYRTGSAAEGMAWIATEGRAQTSVGGKVVDRLTTETMILRKTSGGWRIVHVHWSSRAVPTRP